MTIVMNMSGYEIEREVVPDEYGDEVMYTGWNPQLAEISESKVEPAMPGGLARAEVDSFLDKMYKYQR